jgi:hypothetical protein
MINLQASSLDAFSDVVELGVNVLVSIVMNRIVTKAIADFFLTQAIADLLSI